MYVLGVKVYLQEERTGIKTDWINTRAVVSRASSSQSLFTKLLRSPWTKAHLGPWLATPLWASLFQKSPTSGARPDPPSVCFQISHFNSADLSSSSLATVLPKTAGISCILSDLLLLVVFPALCPAPYQPSRMEASSPLRWSYSAA